jgi:hypothetical protein
MGLYDLADPSALSQLGVRIPQGDLGYAMPDASMGAGSGINIPTDAGAGWGLMRKPTDWASLLQTAANAAQKFAPQAHPVLQGPQAPRIMPSYAPSVLQMSPYVQAYMQRMAAMRNTLTPGPTGVTGLLGGHNGTA